ncbi:hypothetical protein EV182_002925 [Spiromyces aspiralis]|uniref:Uncharacterized protein n=1 Tax=Spiromyces aspiralis TaxID=68401 RepID=A0ACC1HUT4_9FUNG|nr:hypothetical protein EV182_002925 [Spiromyces aspiralis]
MASLSPGLSIGSASARAGIYNETGHLISSVRRPILIHKPFRDHYEQSTEDIWAAIVYCVRGAVAKAKEVIPSFVETQVKGIGFDATCSLAVVDFQTGDPIPVTLGNPGTPMPAEVGASDPIYNIVMWQDHRASEEAALINRNDKAQKGALKYVGGKVSPEMEIPKILWLYKRYKELGLEDKLWRRVAFMDLPDYIVYRATGASYRSTCSLVCKQMFEPSEHCSESATDGKRFKGWTREMFAEIGLECLVESNFAQLGASPDDGRLDPVDAGVPVSNGLCAEVAEQLGLAEGTAVSAAVIDAYSGFLGTIAANVDCGDRNGIGGSSSTTGASDIGVINDRLAIIAGTSACHLQAQRKPVFVPGVWGPYYSAAMSGWHFLEGGQSAVGSLLDYIIESHAAYPLLASKAEERDVSPYHVLNEHLHELAQRHGLDSAHIGNLVADLHCLPDYKGNRAPLADPTLRGMFVGEYMAPRPDDLSCLALRYLACLVGLAFGTRAIIEAIELHSQEKIRTLMLSGGLCKNQLFIKLIADVTGTDVVVPAEIDGAVLLGSAILGAAAFENSKQDPVLYSRESNAEVLWQAMKRMTPPGTVIEPTADPDLVLYYDRKYRVFRRMQQDQKEYQQIMAGHQP